VAGAGGGGLSPTLVEAPVAEARAALLELGGRESIGLAAAIEGLASVPAFQVMAAASLAARPQWAGLVDDLFELSRIHSGVLPLDIETLPVSELVNDALLASDAVARSRGVRLDGQAEPDGYVRADARELARVVANLMVNAIRHTPSDGVVALQAVRDGNEVEISVRDACGGIDEAERSGALVFHAGTARDSSGRLVTAGGRVLTVVATGPTIQDARQRAYENVQRIHFQGCQFRSDTRNEYGEVQWDQHDANELECHEYRSTGASGSRDGERSGDGRRSGQQRGQLRRPGQRGRRVAGRNQ